MNDRDAAGGELLKYRAVPKTPLQNREWSKSIVAMLIMIFMGLTMISPESALAQDQVSGMESSEGTGIQVGSWLLSIPYCVGKSAFAIAGSVVGGLGYVFSGGNEKTAQSVWTTSIYGTYILRPAHLRGEEPIEFLGKADGDGSQPAAPLKRASAASGPFEGVTH